MNPDLGDLRRAGNIQIVPLYASNNWDNGEGGGGTQALLVRSLLHVLHFDVVNVDIGGSYRS